MFLLWPATMRHGRLEVLHTKGSTVTAICSLLLVCSWHTSALAASSSGSATRPSILPAISGTESMRTPFELANTNKEGRQAASRQNTAGMSHVSQAGHSLRSLLQSAQLQTAIDPANSAGESALNKQQCVTDTTSFPYSAVGFMTFQPGTDAGCAAALIAGDAIYTSNECFVHKDFTKMYFQPGRSSCSSTTLQADVAGLTNAWWFENVTDICGGSDLTDACHQAYGWGFATLNVSYPASWTSLNLSAVANPVPQGVLNTIGYVGSNGVNHCDSSKCEMHEGACAFQPFNGSAVYTDFRCKTQYFGQGAPVYLYEKGNGERSQIGMQTAQTTSGDVLVRLLASSNYQYFTDQIGSS